MSSTTFRSYGNHFLLTWLFRYNIKDEDEDNAIANSPHQHIRIHFHPTQMQSTLTEFVQLLGSRLVSVCAKYAPWVVYDKYEGPLCGGFQRGTLWEQNEVRTMSFIVFYTLDWFPNPSRHGRRLHSLLNPIPAQRINERRLRFSWKSFSCTPT